MKKLSMNDVPQFLGQVGAAMDLFTPIAMSGAVNWGVWDQDRTVDLKTLKSVKSPKDVFFPQCQTMYTVQKDENGFSIDPMKLTEKPFCVFGIRPCDVKALVVMDQVFLADPVDTFYKARREHAILVSLACHRPAQTCFCSVFGTDAAECEGADVAMWMIGDELFMDGQTEKGNAFLEQFSELLNDTDDTKAVSSWDNQTSRPSSRLPSLPETGWNREVSR